MATSFSNIACFTVRSEPLRSEPLCPLPFPFLQSGDAMLDRNGNVGDATLDRVRSASKAAAFDTGDIILDRKSSMSSGEDDLLLIMDPMSLLCAFTASNAIGPRFSLEQSSLSPAQTSCTSPSSSSGFSTVTAVTFLGASRLPGLNEVPVFLLFARKLDSLKRSV